MTVLMLIIIGSVAGILSGLLGVGGGIIIVPALVLLLGYTQKTAQGTTMLLLVPPIGILGAITYYRHGHADIKAAAFIIAGFVVGSLLGAIAANHISDSMLTKIFAIFLVAVGVRLLF